MKKLTIIGSVIIAVGLIVFTAAFGAAGWDMKKLSTDSEYTESRESFESTNQDIVIKDDVSDIDILPSEDGMIHLVCWESENETYSVTDGNTLTIEKTEHYEWYERIFNFRFESHDVTVMIPEGYTGSIYAYTNTGKVDVREISSSGIEVTADNGEVSLRDLTVSGALRANTSNGSIQAENVVLDGELAMGTANGNIDIGNVSAEHLTAKSDNGEITLNGVQVSGETNIGTDNGDISINGFEPGPVTELETSLGEISGSINGELRDFTVSSYTDLGENSLPESLPGGEKELTVKTDMGDIDITFIK